MVLLCLCIPLHAVPVVPMEAAWREARPGDTPATVLGDFRNGELQSFDPDLLHEVARPGQATWVVLRPQLSPVTEERTLTLYPPPLSAVTLYDSHGPLQTLSLDDFSARVHGHGRLAWRLVPGASSTEPILLRFEASPDAASPVRFRLQLWDEYLRQDAQWLVFASACFAVMLAMAAMALCLALMLRDATFAWYAGYVLCYAVIQGVRTGYLFHPLELEWLAGSALLVGPTAALLSVAFAAVFVARFCELQRLAPLLHTAALALAMGMPLLVLMRSSHIDAIVAPAQALLYPALLIGAVLLLCAGMTAAARGSRRARYFLLGFTPLLAFTALDSAQTNGVLHGVDWLGDAALAAGAFQSIMLALGLADHALAMRHDTDVVRELADVDALTQVLNRRAWSEGLHAALARDDGEPIALLFLDLDHFKTLNDCQGHAAGDRALVAVADALRRELRPQDLLGRYGGEEFVAMLHGVDQAQATHIATRLCRRVYRLDVPVDGQELLLSVSVGIAMRRPDDTVETLVERADHAMYRAKLNGRNRVRLDLKPEARGARPWPRAVVEEPPRRGS
jgi:diguanylate cyclase (GGDEF)-like protein